MRSRERSQTEVIGFSLIFGLVILAIGLVGVTAFTGLDNAQEFQETTSTEQAFVVLAENIEDTNRGGVPSRETTIGLSEAALSLEATEQINITVEDGTTVAETSIETQPIVYESRDDTSISYHSGLLVRDDDGSALSFREPGFVLTNEAVVLPIVRTTAAEERTIAGTSDVRVVTRSTGTRVVAADEFPSQANVTIEITSPYADVWAASLRGDADVCNQSGETVRCSIDTNEVFISVEDVEVELR